MPGARCRFPGRIRIRAVRISARSSDRERRRGESYSEGETILAADLDLDEIARAKFDLDVVGHYARPDVFRLEVTERATAPVVGTAPAIEEPDEAPLPAFLRGVG